MITRRSLILVAVTIVGLTLAACGPAEEVVVDDGSAERIAELEAALAEAEAAGVAEDEVAALQDELDALSGELAAAQGSRCTYNGYRMGWVMDYADANNIVNEVFGPTSDFQYTFWQLDNPDAAASFEGLVGDALSNPDLDSRSSTWQEAERLVVDEQVAVLPLWHYDNFNMFNADVNYFFPPFGASRVAQWSLESGGTTIRLPVNAAVPTLDIQRATDTTSSAIIYQLIDAPYGFNEEGGIEPLAASSFEVSDDGTVYTIALRDNAVWSDGEPVTAQHYVDGITRLLDPELAADYAYVMFAVAGAAEYNAGELDSLESIRAVDDFTLEVTLTEQLSYFDSILAFSTMHPVRLDVIDTFGDEWTQPGNFVSNGAYILAEHNPGENVVLEKNPTYWDADNVAIERVEIPIIEELATILAAFENGEVDGTGLDINNVPC